MSVELAGDGFDELMSKVERERGFAVASYKQTCLRRRVASRMRACGVDSLADYYRHLERDTTELDRLVGALTVSVTSFFRDPEVWRPVAEHVVPELWHSERTDVRIWSAGCASGEEAYALAMLFHRHASVQGMLSQIDRVQILATDL